MQRWLENSDLDEDVSHFFSCPSEVLAYSVVLYIVPTTLVLISLLLLMRAWRSTDFQHV
jgi:hypothetical protein